MAWTLVTGGAKRLGAEISLSLAKAGYDVVIHYHRSQAEAQALRLECQQLGVKCEIIQGDFSSVESTLDFTRRYIKQFPDTQHLINNVGNYLIKSALNTTVDEWTALFQTNLTTPFILIRQFVPSLIRLQGAIINIGTSGIIFPRANTDSTAYSLTKGALWTLTRSLAKELALHQVRVNMVSPGYLDIAVDLPENPESLPMKRPATCAEVGRVITFLLDRDSSYITGQNIEVAGGVGLK